MTGREDIIARDPEGALTTFQLKGGNIDLSTWRAIKGEIEELVQLPVMLPGVDRDEPHAPFLVTNGELRGDAIPSIREYSDLWHCGLARVTDFLALTSTIAFSAGYRFSISGWTFSGTGSRRKCFSFPDLSRRDQV
jgi:hypothetical protein